MKIMSLLKKKNRGDYERLVGVVEEQCSTAVMQSRLKSDRNRGRGNEKLGNYKCSAEKERKKNN